MPCKPEKPILKTDAATEIAQIAQEFLQSLPMRRQSLLGSDSQEALRHAHNLKGSAAMLGFGSLSAAAARFEAASPQSLGAAEALADLIAQIDAAVAGQP